jgi:tRNA nucleotidyltransferase (CCA-adding enzyme)
MVRLSENLFKILCTRRVKIRIKVSCWNATIRKITFVRVYLVKIDLYDSGQRCGPWASCSESKSHNFVKNYVDWNQTWSVAWYGKTMYQISNEYLKTEKKQNLQKLTIPDICLTPKVITSWKINTRKRNSNLICNLVWQSNVPNIKWIYENTKKKCRKTYLPHWRTDVQTGMMQT